MSTRDLYQEVVLDYLKQMQAEENRLQGIDLDGLTLKQAFEDHVSFTVS